MLEQLLVVAEHHVPLQKFSKLLAVQRLHQCVEQWEYATSEHVVFVGVLKVDFRYYVKAGPLNHELNHTLVFALQKGFQELYDFYVQVDRLHLFEFAYFLDHSVLNEVQTHLYWNLRLQDKLGQELQNEAPAEFNTLPDWFVFELFIDKSNEVPHNFIYQDFA